MAIETYGLTVATLSPYLSSLENQVGTSLDAMSDTDIEQIIEDEAAKVGIALMRSLASNELPRSQVIAAIVADTYGSRAARAVLISQVLTKVYQSVFQGSVLPEYLTAMRAEARRDLAQITVQPEQLAQDVVRQDFFPVIRDEDDVDSISSLFVDTGRSRLDRW